MNTQIHRHTGSRCMLKTIELFTLTALVQNTFLQKLKNLLVIKTLKQIYLGYKHMIRLCVVIFVLSLLNICLIVKV